MTVENEPAAAGYDVGIVADLNRDGMDEVLVSETRATGEDNYATAGRTYVIFGKADNTPVSMTDLRNGIGGFSINGGGEQNVARPGARSALQIADV